MLTSVIATDRDEIDVMANSIHGEAWVLVRLSKSNSDHSWFDFSVNIEVARKLATLLPDAIKEAEQLVQRYAQQPAAETSDA